MLNIISICQQRDLPVGLVSYLRIEAANGSLDIGGVTWSPPLLVEV